MKLQRTISLAAISFFCLITIATFFTRPNLAEQATAGGAPLGRERPTPEPGTFDQTAAIAKLREQIKGKEKESAETVFKNIQTPMFKGAPAARLLAVMEFGYSRSLGVNCTHCHVPDKWESEEKLQKQIARDMSAMVSTINGDLLSKIKNLKGTPPTINCTTCHRGEVKPALNLPAAK